MTPRKPRQPQNQPHLTHQPSDYESDLNYLSDIPPPPPTRTDAELNLSVIKRHDATVLSLEYIAPFAVVYIFSMDTQQWEKSGIEGTVFLCRLSPTKDSPERYSVIVLNRRGLDNFNVELLSTADIEVTEDYIILQSANQGVPLVYGLWIFCEPPPSSTSHHRATIAQKIEECAERAERSRHQVSGHEGNGYNGEAQRSEPMGRQQSLQELFEQQRQQDDGWSIKTHSPQARPTQFVSSADTDFFRASGRHKVPHSPTVSAQSDGQARDVLADFVRKAGSGFGGV
ncbi:hypothetical protein MMC24_004623 [Lignoscripta atroalba]|nr:hypothetical protein [Lignoscripta atroalba]